MRLLRPINACAAAHDSCTGLKQQVMRTLKAPFMEEQQAATSNS
jgi:hypothetical protein